ncbi:Transient receptor potential cation channel gamma isoform D [Paragonimus heterotremus]|uniref:Transient receptor potential cation channel gamma isoform D n=1 Tax=Paragonimus heterotremus TaxID=100268 RepID=A0A8J4TIW3_9TREM|nr:Transient receptor potential cation channel gamma isoform D [Paragonimus heterotremus]
MSGLSDRPRYTFSDVVDVAVFQHKATKKSHRSARFGFRRARCHRMPSVLDIHPTTTSTIMPMNDTAVPMTQKRTTSRQCRSTESPLGGHKMNIRGIGEVEENDIRKEVNKVISEVEKDLNEDVPVRCAQRPTTLDMGGLHPPLEEGELSRAERCFLQAAEQGDLSTLKQLIDRADQLKLNLNCTDTLGRDVLRIVIENEHLESLAVLLSIPQIDLRDSLLHAINEDNMSAVDLILHAEVDRASRKNLKGLLGRIQSSCFTPDVTPIMLAAHRDNYLILKMLLDRGDRILKPHDLSCACHTCVQARRTDGLQHSKLRINTYRALTSPSFIILTSNDPILSAFEMSWELRKLGELENEFRTEYEELSNKCEDFATKLLEETRSSVELSVVLNHDTGSREIGGHVRGITPSQTGNTEEGYLKLPRLKLAIKYEQKKFVAHPHCQQLLASMWYDGLPGFRQKPLIAQMVTIVVFCALFPMLAVCYMLAPNSKAGGLLRKPFIKFLCHSSSYLSFLGLLLLTAVRIESLVTNTMDERMNDRGPLPSISESTLVVYIIGFVWQEMKKVYTWGFRAYVADMWHLLDFIMTSMYISTISMRAVACFRIWAYNEPRFVNRGHWDPFDPILIAECLFAGANIVSTLRLVYIFTISPQLGPLQISLGRMLYDIFKFFCVYLLVIVAFAFGLNQLFWFYANNRARDCKHVHFTLEEGQKDVYDYCITRGTHFTNLFEIAQSLYWSTYGLIDLTSFNLEYPHVFTEFVGKYVLHGVMTLYHTQSVSIFHLLKLKITTGSLVRFQQQVDVEWKFARSKLWISYFAEGCTVPVPFNLLPTPKSFMYFLQSVRNWFQKCSSDDTHTSEWDMIKNHVKLVKEREARYSIVMRELTKRYIMKKLRTSESDTVGADDLNEIKGDISAFRFELLDILKANGMNIPVVHRNANKLRRGRDGFQASECEDLASFKEDLFAQRCEQDEEGPAIDETAESISTLQAPQGSEQLGGPVDNFAFIQDDMNTVTRVQTVECVQEIQPTDNIETNVFTSDGNGNLSCTPATERLSVMKKHSRICAGQEAVLTCASEYGTIQKTKHSSEIESLSIEPSTVRMRVPTLLTSVPQTEQRPGSTKPRVATATGIEAEYGSAKTCSPVATMTKKCHNEPMTTFKSELVAPKPTLPLPPLVGPKSFIQVSLGSVATTDAKSLQVTNYKRDGMLPTTSATVELLSDSSSPVVPTGQNSVTEKKSVLSVNNIVRVASQTGSRSDFV